jgi:hypothetical protein
MKTQPTYSKVAEAGVAGAAFVEVECRTSQELCSKYQAGAGGWPTLVTFTKQTGLAGARFQQKTQGMVCDELKVEANLRAHVEATLKDAAAAAEL